jgi:hypothetical protein
VLLYYTPAPDHPLGSVQEFAQRLVRVHADYVVVTPEARHTEPPYLRQLLKELSGTFPGSLSSVYGDEASGYVVYRIDRMRLGA